MYKSKKKLAILCAVIFVVLEMWMVLSVHCWAAKTNNDEKSYRPFVSDRLKIHSIISIKTVSDEAMDTSSCRLCLAIPDGNLSM